MNAELKTCPQCGAAIPTGAPEGMCPKCLLAGASIQTETGTVSAAKTHRIPPTVEEVAAAFPHLEILELIGQGGMGFVFRGRQPKLERDVAIKILPQHLAEDPKFAGRFAREGILLARLNHPNIVGIFDFGESGGFYYLLMEFVDGVNLRQAMRASRFTAEQALSIVPKICEALQFAHNEGVLHRDIKPENILLDSKGRVKIADFGIAKLMEKGAATFLSPGEAPSKENPATGMSPFQESSDSNLTVAGTSLGTPHYMAPEQIDEPGTVDHRADIYSLGVVFYELLTGELPVGKFAPPSSKTPVNAEVDQVVLRALEKQRERRQQSAGELKTQVETIGTRPRSAFKADAQGQARSDYAVLSDFIERISSWRVPASISCVGFYFCVVLVVALTPSLTSPDRLPLMLVFSCATVPFIWWFTLRKLKKATTSDSDDIKRLTVVGLEMVGVVGALLSIPAVAFGLFFLVSMLSERGGWHPDLPEALFVPLTWIGSVLLPASAYQLLTVSSRPAFLRAVSPWRMSVAFVVTGLGFLLTWTPSGVEFPLRWAVLFGGILTISAGFLLMIWSMTRGERPVPRTDNPWPRRVFWLIIVLIVLPIGLLVISVMITMLAWQKSEAPEGSTAAQQVVDSQDWWIGSYRLVEMLDDGRSLTDEELENISAPREMMSWLSPEGWRFERDRNPWTLFESIESQDFNRVLVNLTERKGQLEIARDGPDRLRVWVLGIPELVTVLERTNPSAVIDNIKTAPSQQP